MIPSISGLPIMPSSQNGYSKKNGLVTKNNDIELFWLDTNFKVKKIIDTWIIKTKVFTEKVTILGENGKFINKVPTSPRLTKPWL